MLVAMKALRVKFWCFMVVLLIASGEDKPLRLRRAGYEFSYHSRLAHSNKSARPDDPFAGNARCGPRRRGRGAPVDGVDGVDGALPTPQVSNSSRHE